MADSTLDLIQHYYSAFNRGDDEGLLALLTDDVVHDVNQGDREVGKAAFRVFLQRMHRCYQEQLVELTYCVSADGTRAAAEYMVLGTYKATDSGLPVANGQSYKLAGGAFFAVEQGRICRVTNYYNLPQWLRQVGAS
jgi:steroid delta-isomerase-like uncharacterized protein